FVCRMAEEADCGLLLDVTNVYVSSVNHEFDPVAYVEAIPAERVVQCHLAGHTNCGTHLIDTHDGHVVDPVWNLFRLLHQRTGGVATLLEWDAEIPPFPVVHQEVLKARQYMDENLAVPNVVVSEAEPVHVDTQAIPHPASFIVADFE
ncbi:MAG: DUF692 family protein, partial [Planctomycetaceae bacterium]|nr:DUF692 family protein [Planctomycetaceae bacterium]